MYFFSENSIIKTSYGNNLYHLYKELSQDNDLDIVELVRESTTVPGNARLLGDYSRDDISQVYLFFDMDPHDTRYSPSTLMSMVQLFDEETEHGKLFVSYPMVEAIRDLSRRDAFLNTVIDVVECGDYKRISADRCDKEFLQTKKYSRKVWQEILIWNTQKANYIAFDSKISLRLECTQVDILQGQLGKYLSRHQLAVLSGFAIFIVDYHGPTILTATDSNPG
ncbi:hypothetical protein OLMES_3891 [Oleiphilus messinensis]|uniref:Uncharacterized protein n=2 Tax=Oleiphilus messinensis TaxID=141451 RepID=A0A1Y0IBQ6_9GAMM|nr:hypothetical protein OLMES_3891 [Oleiphilus messinensis]